MPEEKQGVFDASDCPLILTRPYDIAKVLTRYKFFEMTRAVPGDVVECGVYKGSGLIAMSNIFKLLDPLCINKKIIGFDTFSGFASVCEQDQVDGQEPIENGMLNTGADVRGPSNDNTGYEILQEVVAVNNKLAAGMPEVVLVQGDLAECLPEFLGDYGDIAISLLIIDVDIYKPTLSILKHLVPRVVPGGIVGVDDFSSGKFKGCARAFKEFYGNKIPLKKFDHDYWMTYFEVTPEIIEFTKERGKHEPFIHI